MIGLASVSDADSRAPRIYLETHYHTLFPFTDIDSADKSTSFSSYQERKYNNFVKLNFSTLREFMTNTTLSLSLNK